MKFNNSVFDKVDVIFLEDGYNYNRQWLISKKPIFYHHFIFSVEDSFFYSYIYTTFKHKKLQSPDNLNLYITWENKKWIKNLI